MTASRKLLYVGGSALAVLFVAGFLVVRMFFPNACSSAGPASGYAVADKRAASEADLVPALLEGEFYNDRFTVEAYLDGGIEIYTSAFVTNFGMGDHKLKFKSRVKLSPDRVLRGGDKELARESWAFVASPFSITADGQKLSGAPERLVVQGSGEGYTFELTYEPAVAPWRPGAGRITFGSAESFLDTFLIQPKSKVKGWLEVDGARREVSGHGYALRTYGNVAPHDAAKWQLDVRAIEGDTVLYLRHFKTPDAAGGAEMGFLLLAKGGEVIFESTEFKVEYSRLVLDEEHENKYEVPEALTIRAENAGRSLELSINTTARTKREDMNKSLSAMEKALVGRFAKPVAYTYAAEFTAKVTGTQTVEGGGKARYEFNHINK
jgi:hypothetical protein